MLKKSFSFTFWIMMVGLLMVTACTPSTTNQNTVESSDGTINVSNADDSSNQEVGISEPSGGVGDMNQNESDEMMQSLSGKTTLYKDDMYKFSVTYPSEFKFSIQTTEKLAELSPTPSASFIFINPRAAASDIAESEPADLEVRVYDAVGETSLDHWLASVNLANGSTSQPFQTTNVSGIKLCSSTMIAPGCSFFVLSNTRIYQLRPASLVGENMIETFMLVP